MKRRLFKVLTVLSLVLCAATLGLSVRACWLRREALSVTSSDPELVATSDYWSLNTNRQGFWLESYDTGTLVLGWYTAKPFGNRGHFNHVASIGGGDRFDPFQRCQWKLAGFGLCYEPAPLDPSGRIRYVALPHWFATAIALVLSALFGRPWLRERRRLQDGLCPSCGYDLRATPERCPECGTAVGIAVARNPRRPPCETPSRPRARGICHRGFNDHF
jgi:hypothetical protein